MCLLLNVNSYLTTQFCSVELLGFMAVNALYKRHSQIVQITVILNTNISEVCKHSLVKNVTDFIKSINLCDKL